MKAIAYETYGSQDALELSDIERPSVEHDQVLVRVRVAAINPFDWHYLRGLPYLVRLVNGLRRPRRVMVLGSDMAGVVEAVGRNVLEFEPGDEVYAEVGTGPAPSTSPFPRIRSAGSLTRGGERYDVMLDTVGNRSLSECRRVVTPDGVYGATEGGGGRWLGPLMPQLKAVLLSPFVGQTLAAVNDKPNESLEFLNELIDGGQIMPVIDRTYPLSEAPEAMRYLEEGHARGKVVITI